MQRYLILWTLLTVGVTNLYADTAESDAGATSNGYISLKTAFGTSFSVYAAGDEKAENGVLLIPDQWGLDDNVRHWADRFAKLGYRALAVDLYDSRRVSDAKMAAEVFSQIDPVWIDADLKGALKYMKQSQHHIVSMGWGVGAEHALMLALQEPRDISAVIAYYGLPVTDDQSLNVLNGPVLTIFAKRDVTISDEKIKTFEESMAVLGKKLVELNLDADHGFANPRAKTYNEHASNEAWDATQEFLTRYLAASGKN